MEKHINTSFRRFILEKIKSGPRNRKEDVEEVQPDEILDYGDIDDEPEEEPFDLDYDEEESLVDDEDEVQDDDDLIKELYQKYKKLQRQYEHRLHKRKPRKTVR